MSSRAAARDLLSGSRGWSGHGYRTRDPSSLTLLGMTHYWHFFGLHVTVPDVEAEPFGPLTVSVTV